MTRQAEAGLTKNPLILSQEFTGILNQLEKTNDSYFITGKAGTGKSVLLQLFRKTSKKRIAVVAPTGIAALNVKGQTIHSFFRFAPRILQAHDIQKVRNHRLYKNMDTLIIDEISMVRADVLDNIDYFLRKNRENDQAFGGVQLVVFGDLFQLPPVISSNFEREYFKTHYESPYFFSAKVLQNNFPLQLMELHEVYRQDDRSFIRLLDNIRLSHVDYDDLEALNERYQAEVDPDKSYITLCSLNGTANAINSKELNQLETSIHEFSASIQGNFRNSNFPTDQFLQLKEGAQVMFIKNDPKRRFVNGTLGTIISLSPEMITVSVKDNFEQSNNIEVSRADWEILKYTLDPNNPKGFKTEVTGAFNQFPLKLAWAITIHKSQGKTFNHVIIDLGRGAFEYGQTYVALSRCRSLEGIILKQQLKGKDIMTDQRITEYYETIRYYS